MLRGFLCNSFLVLPWSWVKGHILPTKRKNYMRAFGQVSLVIQTATVGQNSDEL